MERVSIPLSNTLYVRMPYRSLKGRETGQYWATKAREIVNVGKLGRGMGFKLLSRFGGDRPKGSVRPSRNKINKFGPMADFGKVARNFMCLLIRKLFTVPWQSISTL